MELDNVAMGEGQAGLHHEAGSQPAANADLSGAFTRASAAPRFWGAMKSTNVDFFFF